MDAIHDLRSIAVREALGEIVGSDVIIDTALRAVLQGVDSPNLALLAGLGRSEEGEAHDLFRRVVDELDIAPPAPIHTESARWDLIHWTCEAIVAGGINPERGGSIIWHDCWHELGYPDALLGIVGAVSALEEWSPLRETAREDLEHGIVEEAQRLLSGPWPPTVVERFADATALWRISPAHTAEVIDAAVTCLVAGADTPSLRVLAGASPTESQFVLDPLISDTLAELELPTRAESAQSAGMRAIARRYQRGEIAARELTSWAHRFIGHDGDERCRVFVDLDDEFAMEFDQDNAEQLLRREVAAFLNGHPSPMDAEPRRAEPQSGRRRSSLFRFLQFRRRSP